MTKPPRMTYADKQAMLAHGEPWIVHPREVAKLPEFQGTDPEIILACILEAGILDTGDILTTVVNQRYGLAVTDDATAAYEGFRRVWGYRKGCALNNAKPDKSGTTRRAIRETPDTASRHGRQES